MYRIAVCDDEKSFLDEMGSLINQYLKENEIAAKWKCYSSEMFLLDEVKEEQQADIYFLDIQMGAMSGMEVAGQIRKLAKDAIIIFVTAHMQYAVASFELEIFRYIPKSQIRELLPKALGAAFMKLDLQKDQFFYISNAKRSLKIPLSEILYVYKEGKNSVLVLMDREVRVREPLFEVYQKLPGADFIQADRCCIVNIRYIYKVDAVQCRIVLKHHIGLDISKNRIQEIKKVVNLYWGTKI